MDGTGVDVWTEQSDSREEKRRGIVPPSIPSSWSPGLTCLPSLTSSKLSVVRLRRTICIWPRIRRMSPLAPSTSAVIVACRKCGHAGLSMDEHEVDIGGSTLSPPGIIIVRPHTHKYRPHFVSHCMPS